MGSEEKYNKQVKFYRAKRERERENIIQREKTYKFYMCKYC